MPFRISDPSRPMNEANFAQFLIQHLVEYAAWLVGALVGLLYTITRAELGALKAALKKTISTVDFEKHEVREMNDRRERRDAEKSIREQVIALDMRIDSKLNSLDAKMEKKLDSIISNMMQAAMSPHNRRTGDA
jgi:Tfp pilus assembly protein PilN